MSAEIWAAPSKALSSVLCPLLRQLPSPTTRRRRLRALPTGIVPATGLKRRRQQRSGLGQGAKAASPDASAPPAAVIVTCTSTDTAALPITATSPDVMALREGNTTADMLIGVPKIVDIPTMMQPRGGGR